MRSLPSYLPFRWHSLSFSPQSMRFLVTSAPGMEAGPHSVLMGQGRGGGNLTQLEADWGLQFSCSLLALWLFPRVRAVSFAAGSLFQVNICMRHGEPGPGHQSLQASSTLCSDQRPTQLLGRPQMRSPAALSPRLLALGDISVLLGFADI